MILSAFMHGRVRYAESWPEMMRLVMEVVENLPDPESEPDPEPIPEALAASILEIIDSLPEPSWPAGGMTAEFAFIKQRQDPDDLPHQFDNYLGISVNAATGYGALMWFVTDDTTLPVAPSIAEHVWVSDNPHPPAFDPHVFSDPGFPRYHYPRSTLPVAQIRAALEEFCRTGTGQRPECIDWTPGDLGGGRLDTPEPEERIMYCEDPWCEMAGTQHPEHPAETSPDANWIGTEPPLLDDYKDPSVE
ncbi:Imm1 family immunity protein [Nonomuraea sp. B19D2]|uniref:Imm1 family immunity protein n=1 Tax=Nonomuraea sp. B19D2 TaxID=3159561 RepID=UPI0032D9C20A